MILGILKSHSSESLVSIAVRAAKVSHCRTGEEEGDKPGDPTNMPSEEESASGILFCDRSVQLSAKREGKEKEKFEVDVGRWEVEGWGGRG